MTTVRLDMTTVKICHLDRSASAKWRDPALHSTSPPNETNVILGHKAKDLQFAPIAPIQACHLDRSAQRGVERSAVSLSPQICHPERSAAGAERRICVPAMYTRATPQPARTLVIRPPSASCRKSLRSQSMNFIQTLVNKLIPSLTA
jgi:hypothetical protein